MDGNACHIWVRTDCLSLRISFTGEAGYALRCLGRCLDEVLRATPLANLGSTDSST